MGVLGPKESIFHWFIIRRVLITFLYAGFCQEAKVKKIMSKKDRKEKKMFSSKDDEHFLLTGVKLAARRG